MGVTGCRNPGHPRSEERFGARKDREEDKVKDKGALKLDTPTWGLTGCTHQC